MAAYALYNNNQYIGNIRRSQALVIKLAPLRLFNELTLDICYSYYQKNREIGKAQIAKSISKKLQPCIFQGSEPIPKGYKKTVAVWRDYDFYSKLFVKNDELNESEYFLVIDLDALHDVKKIFIDWEWEYYEFALYVSTL